MKPIRFLIVIAIIMWTVAISYGQAKESRQIQPFKSIKTAGLVQVHLQPGDTESLRLEVKGIGLQDIITKVENGELVIKTEGNYNGEDIQVYVTYKEINGIAVGGASRLYGKSVIKAEELSVSTSAGGDAFLTVDVDSLNIMMEGAGNLTIKGKASTEKIITTDLEQGTLDRTGLITSN